MLTATDITGLATTATFTENVAVVAPTVSGGRDMQFDSGQAVPFHGNGADAGAADRLALLYSWNFDDPADPLGGAGQDVSHTYNQPGVRTAVVTVSDKDGASSTDSIGVTITKRDTTTTYTGAVAGNKSDPTVLRSALVDEYGNPVVGRLIEFKVDGSTVGFALTNGVGVATYVWTIPLATSVGSHSVDAVFTTDAMYNGSSATSSITVSKDNTILVSTGVFQAKPSKAVPLSAKLTDDEGNAVAGKTIVFVLGAQTCSGTTNASGIASCTIAKLNQNPGNYTLTASFAGDGNYNASTDSDPFRIGN